ncbi:nucleoside deaminase [Herbiconiux ginsengi]|uniref:tRNA(Arg) A34 adenosine deaminase TadA n=1 Tax=Herbiconiux ginsengi TaxID=381665 RepID=A0A1H3LCE5_9MICO|nr:nucleoside deaminase [Herbiconiux ginsengi]SDY62103.1 tRNA(Arg) A34 adenosine deaminase TadA [Herbiconiux ginsengi]
MAASETAASVPFADESVALDSGDRAHLERAVALAQAARDRGDHPFGALLVTADGVVIEAMNTVNTGHDPIGHAETNLVRDSGQRLEMAELAGSTLYTSTEPCAMCSGAIYWAGIPRVVFALSESELRELVAAQEGVPTMALPCREVFAHGGRDVEVVGPVALAEATEVHRGFWV